MQLKFALSNTYLHTNSLNAKTIEVDEIIINNSVSSIDITNATAETLNVTTQINIDDNVDIYRNAIYQPVIRSAFNFDNNMNVTMLGGIVCTSVTNPHNSVYQCFMTLPSNYNITGSANRSNNNGQEMYISPYDMTTTSFKVILYPNNNLNSGGFVMINVTY